MVEAKKTAKKVSKKATTAKVAAKTTNTTENKKSVKKISQKQLENLAFQTTEEIPLSENIIDSIVGQEDAVNIIRKAAKQRRHVLLIGEPGTGKSMLGMALAQMLPKEKLVDILSFQNGNDENQPLIRVMPASQGRQWVQRVKMETGTGAKGQFLFMFIIFLGISLIPWWLWKSGYWPDVVYATSLIASMIMLIGFVLILNVNKRMGAGQGTRVSVPKVIVDNADKKTAPFLDATGSHAGALLGDVLHDPFQSGGLGTPAHERVVAGMIHKANNGVLFIDEIATLGITTQQELLTAIQEGKFAITGQSERSAGAMVRTEPVPCNFVLVAAGNLDTVEHMHPALRSRIRGYGYEVYMKESMPENSFARAKIAQFVAQEVNKDKKIPPFSKAAVEVVIEQARRRADRKGHVTLRLRELGGVIRAAGDYAVEKGATIVEPEHIHATKNVVSTLEHQLTKRYIERTKEYEVIQNTGAQVGRVNGLAVIGSGASHAGLVLSIESEVVDAQGPESMKVNATGKLGDIAKEAMINVSTFIRKISGKDMEKHAVYVQFLQTYSGVEGDSASIAVAVSILSAVYDLPIRQDTAMTGSLSVRGTVLPIGGATYKVEAAIEAGMKYVIVPKSNVQDIVVSQSELKKIKVISVTNLWQVIDHIFDWKGKEKLHKRFSQVAQLKK